jgi:uncharacterized membrane protein YfcA
MSLMQLALIGLAAFAAGAVNALAGGGTLIIFPVLVAAGFPALAANITSTIALCPGFLGATYAQRADLRGQSARLKVLLPLSLLGGLLGAALLLHTGERKFTEVVPWLLLVACALLASQEKLRTLLASRRGRSAASPLGSRAETLWLLPLVVLVTMYGGFFGPGMSVIILAMLGLVLADPLPRLNALKQAIALATNFAAALWLALRAEVNWPVVTVLALCALLGGVCGGRLAGRLSPLWLRRTVVFLGVIVALSYLWRSR